MNPEDDNARRARNRRSLVIGLALAAFVILVYAVTIVRLGGDVANRVL